MGLISGAIDAALESIGKSLLDVGEWFLQTGYTLWTNAGKLTLDYVKISPMAQSGAWGVVTGSVYQTSLAVAASLAVLFFVMGWLRESIDIRNNFTLENMFRFFVRYAITASLIVNSLSLVTGICECATAITAQVSTDMESPEMESVFETVRESLEDNDDADGGTWIGMGLAGMPDGRNSIFIRQTDILPGRDAETGMRLAAVFTDQRYSMMNLEKVNVVAADGSKAIAMFKLPGGAVVAHGSQQPDRKKGGPELAKGTQKKEQAAGNKTVRSPEKAKSR